ncbi:MAG: aspartate aminotransferase family protein [Candidatus Binatus sp.]|uniref:aspartate aminotransferase family protein n=1 Tax=Candidatus Binatus sp. TaxID=2811406 RepID=UPI0027204E3B|nr:aspartate aminotransferase family protein [Candidatus Binatus sp.]MDO8435002.1 aspartate aminotransferase family protein [Candidatus Binatus sp.]
MTELHELFLKRLAQTSDAPIALEISRAEGCWLVAADGRRYLDLIAGIGVSALGHGHPNVIAAIEAQARRHLHVMVYGEYVIEAQVQLARRLTELLPTKLERVYFTNSGAEAIEGTLKVARKATGREAFAAFDGAYHGDTMGALALAGNPAFRAPFGNLPGPVRHLPFGDSAALDQIDSTIAAVVIEPVQAEGGVRIPAASFMRSLRDRCDQVGALLVFDEVLTGFGRTGKLFALEHFGVVPDIIVMAKALGGGMPLGAFCGSDDLIGTLSHDPPLGHLTTFGGHPLSCAAALASLEVIVADDLSARAAMIGADLARRLREINAPEMTAIRAIGLLIGIEFAEAQFAHRFVAETISRGVIVNWTLNADKVVRLAPPLTIEAAEIDFAVARMIEALDATRQERQVVR